MDWTQTFTIIFTIIGSMGAVWYAFYYIIKEDIKRHDALFSEMSDRFMKMDEHFVKIDERFAKMDERFVQTFIQTNEQLKAEFSKRDALWANLLEKIYKIEQKIYKTSLSDFKKLKIFLHI